jgi:hypothetical protein
VGEGVLEKSPVRKAVADALLEVVELVAQPHDLRPDIFTMALDDRPRRLRGFGANRDANVAERVDRHRPDRVRIAGDAEAADAVAVEQRDDDARFDVGVRRKDDYGFHRTDML